MAPRTMQVGKLFPGNCSSANRHCEEMNLHLACKNSGYRNNTHFCICSFTGEQYQDDTSECQSASVKLSPNTIPSSSKIRVIPQDNSKKNITSLIIQKPNESIVSTEASYSVPLKITLEPIINETTSAVATDVHSDLLLIATSPTFLLASTLLAVCVVISMLVLCCRKRSRFLFFCISKESKAEKKARKMRNIGLMPLSLNKEFSDEERYTSNPLYTSASVTSTECLPVPILSRNSVTFSNEIGEGCFGKVFKGELKTDGKTEVVAIKVLKDNASREAEDDFMREVEIMSSFAHTNILSLLGVVSKEPGKKPWMVFEYMPHGDLAEVLRSNSGHFRTNNPDIPYLTKEQLFDVSRQIAAGMKYLADQRFVHRDLACRNCLVGTNMTVKIADFGMSRDVYTCDYYKIGGSRLLPVRWMSPESVMYGRFTLESDVWSYGVILWEIYSLGKQPYFGHNNEEVIKLILQGIMLMPPENCPRTICEIMSLCWKTEPRDRIKFTEVCERLENPIEEIECTLPRPPALPIATDHLSTLLRHQPQFDVSDDLMDEENYLQPQFELPPPGHFREYFQPLPT